MALHLFVYGTLKGGESQSGLLRGLRRQPARIRGRLYHLPAGYPAVSPGGMEEVWGELVEPPSEALLDLLDQYEGVDSGAFQRVQVPAILGLRTVRAWAWVMEDPGARGGRLLPSGRWTSPRRSWT